MAMGALKRRSIRTMRHRPLRLNLVSISLHGGDPGKVTHASDLGRSQRSILAGVAGWLAADVGDDVLGDVAEFDVAVIGRAPQDREGLVGGASVLGHDDAQGLVD